MSAGAGSLSVDIAVNITQMEFNASRILPWDRDGCCDAPLPSAESRPSVHLSRFPRYYPGTPAACSWPGCQMADQAKEAAIAVLKELLRENTALRWCSLRRSNSWAFIEQ